MVNGMGLVVGRFGRILRTSDGGASWTNIESPTSAHLNSLSFNDENVISGNIYNTDEDVGWAVGDAGTILQTNDRGASWTDITNDVISSLGPISSPTAAG